MNTLADVIPLAANLFDVTGVPALMLSYDPETQDFELWNYLNPAECSDFWIRESRVPLCKITPADMPLHDDTANTDPLDLAWRALAEQQYQPPLHRRLNDPSAVQS